LVSNAWIVLQANSGQQLVFRRNGTNNDNGWLIWLPNGGYTAANGQTPELPGNLPTSDNDNSNVLGVDAFEVRGTFSDPQTYTTPGNWFGASAGGTYERLCIGCRDATGTGNESFWVFHLRTGLTYDNTTAANIGRLSFVHLVHESGLGIADANEYAWWCPQSTTTDWAEGLDDNRSVLTEDNATSTVGRWRRIWNAGQAGESGRRYASGARYQGDANTGDALAGEAPGWESAGDQAIYQVTPQQLVRRIHLTKELHVGLKDPEGGWTEDFYFTNGNGDSGNRDTFGAGGEYAAFGDWATVWWDQVAGPIDTGAAGVNHAAAVVEPVPDAFVDSAAEDTYVHSTYATIDDSEISPNPPTLYLQRIFDNTLVAYVYFTRESTDPSTPPLGVGDTEPNNTGNLDLTNHAILAEV
jgi:hypothetical protein